MQQKNVVILTAVTAVALAAAAMTLRTRSDSVSAPSTPTRLFPELSQHLNELSEVRLEKAGKSATLKKEGGAWKMADRGGYPAQFEKVKELAVRVADLEIEETKTSKKANHKKLAVEWPTTAEEGSEAAEAGLVTFKDGSGKELASLVVGKSEWMGSKPKVYVRRAGEDQVYLCAPRGALDIVPDAKSWIDPKFVELANDRVQDVTIEHADGEKVVIGRSAENHTQFTVENLEPGKTERYAGVANGVAQALGYGLSLEDVRPVTEVDFTKEPLARTHFRCVDGLELVIETAKLDDKVWAKVVASYTPPPEPEKPAEPVPPPAADAKDGEAKPAETPAAEKKDVGKEAADLNTRLAPWAFEIPSYKSDVLVRRMKDLLAEPAPPAAEGGLEGAMQGLGTEIENEPPKEDGEAVDSTPLPDDEGKTPKSPPSTEPK